MTFKFLIRKLYIGNFHIRNGEGAMFNLKLKLKIIERFRTQADFAAAIGNHESFVSLVINGRRTLSDSQKDTWAAMLDTPVDELFDETCVPSSG